jgi:hypothetical protein
MNGQQLWQILGGLTAWQVTEMPRPDSMTGGDAGLAQRVQALAYGAGAGVGP